MQRILNNKVRIGTLAVILTFFLSLSFKTESLWTDEAFSAFIACHRTASSLWHTLRAGDSSDLQMWLYYFYLHVWVLLFGASEFALRSANIPFVFLYALAVAWTRNVLFRSNWVLVAALSPFIWAYAADARPYMAVIALSTVFVACLVTAVTDPRYANSRVLPWVGLCAVLIGLNMHMLMILLLPPSLTFALTYRWMNGSVKNGQRWIRPALILMPLFLAYFIFLAWTFLRGTSYDYAHPDMLSMGSLLFRFGGLAGYAPNRHYDISLRPYVFIMTAASIGLLVAGSLAVWPALRARQAKTVSLAAALMVGILEAFLLSFGFHQQIEVRHMACLFALALFLLFSAWDFDRESGLSRVVSATVLAVATVWLISDFRLTFLPEYRREDFRRAVALAINLATRKDDEIVAVADPAAVAYYGLSVKGKSPCFPLPGTCEGALAAVSWPRLAGGYDGTFWTPQQISAWLQKSLRPGTMQVLLISTSRHPMYLHSHWWLALSKTKLAKPIPFHGFLVYRLSGGEY